MRNIVRLKCVQCDSCYFRDKGRVDEAKRHGWNPYCSKKCQFAITVPPKRVVCENDSCGKTFLKPQNLIRQSAAHYCTRSCAAIQNNRLRPIRSPRHKCGNSGCDKQISLKKKFCSNACWADMARFPKEKHEMNVIKRIQGFYKQHNRIPCKRELQGIYHAAYKTFGSWNAAIEAAGFKPNPVLFSKQHVARDGHRCDSFSEKIIDDWLHERKIPHERNVPYGDGKVTADFKVGNILIEFVGLIGNLKKYDRQVVRKRKLARKLDLDVIELRPSALYPESQLHLMEYELRNAVNRETKHRRHFLFKK